MKRVVLLMALMLMALAVQALSQVTVSYDATVTSATGLHPSAFSAGNRMTITYTLDEDTADANSDPIRGFFPGAVLSMEVSFPDNGVFANSGPAGSAQTINNWVSSGRAIDTVFFNGGPMSSASLLGGEPILQTFVEFSLGLRPPAMPSMISSDELPLFRLPANYTFVAIDTPSGQTYVHFALSGQRVISYEAVVTSASGLHAGVFPAGETVRVSYALDPTATDSNADPSRGLFHDAVLSLSISFPNLSVFADAEVTGLAQTFNNIADPPSGQLSDQVFIHSGPVTQASLLGGETITQTEVDFLSDFVPPPSEPSMLASDALPLFGLPMTDSFVILRTSGGTTFVHFAPPAPERIQTLIDEVEELSAAGTLTAGQADWLIRKLEAAIASIDRGNTRPACNHLQQFIRRVEGYIDEGTLSPGEGQPLIDAARNIREQLGC
jgi:hypothetical protein